MWQHPIVRGAVGVAAFVVVAEITLDVLQPVAWAAVMIPLTERITISLGDLPQWVIAIVAAGGFWKAYNAEKHAREAVGKIEEVRHETNSMRTAIEASKLAQGKREGRAEVRDEIAAEKVVQREDAVADAATAAKIAGAGAEQKE